MLRSEYPRPSFVRDRWLNLNGEWQFEVEKTTCDYLKKENYEQLISVPFCPESLLSGIAHTDFMKSVWYKRDFCLSEEETSGRVVLNFGAVDYYCTVYVNGKSVGSHKGGYVPFAFDITENVISGSNTVVVHAEDDTRDKSIPSGKQSEKKESYGCHYTRTTGIWQTVWLEFSGANYIKSCKITPDVNDKSISFEAETLNDNGVLNVEISYNGNKVAEASGKGALVAYLTEIELWGVLSPKIYDIKMSLNVAGATEDVVNTYCAFRTFEIKGRKFYLNGKPIFLRQVLDQGFYPDGIYTAPSQKAIEDDIDLAISLGFNGARPHQKVFEDSFMYYADKKGYLIWGEFPSWGVSIAKRHNKGLQNFVDEWSEAVKFYYNHPSVIGYCPLNEAWSPVDNSEYYSHTRIMDVTLALDPNRVYIGASGGNIYCGDVWDMHEYTHDAKLLFSKVQKGFIFKTAKALRRNLFIKRPMSPKALSSLPKYLSEYGGMGFTDRKDAWGYNKMFSDETEYVKVYENLTKAVLDSDASGFCFTQLTDVEQECNGLVYYDRTPKFSEAVVKRIKSANTLPAKVEK